MRTWISILLTTLLVPSGLYALSLETSQTAVSQSGGISVVNKVHATGSESASANIRTVIQGGTGSVRVEVKTGADGKVETQTVERAIVPGRPIDIRIATGSANARADARITIGEGAGEGMRDFFSEFFGRFAPTSTAPGLMLPKATTGLGIGLEKEATPVEQTGGTGQASATPVAPRGGFLSQIFANFRLFFNF